MKAYNIAIAGLGGQGIITASDILADAAFRAGYDVKKAEVHGMSQRGGSVNTDVRFGREVLSPMVPDGQLDALVLVDETQEPVNRHRLRPDGCLIGPAAVANMALPNPKTLNVALLGLLSAQLPLPIEAWHEAIRHALPEKAHAANLGAFDLGRRHGETANGES
ncbi:MAG: indolepyruvate oxidoreductase subunit beta [Thermoguttaceae bacterium]|jgi:indolepyruvate ferredoxin oxidoreductase beta subunit|nr:indolepyruvate oxidoreductase subunit beta [Thermoguttaceae bacterium]